MVAVVVESEERDWPHARIVRWADWARCPLPGSVGSSEGYMRERLDTAHDGEPTEEIVVTDKAVAKMRLQRKDYWPAFSRFYLNPSELSEYEIGLQIGHNEERVRAMIRQARMLVGYHILQADQVAESDRTGTEK